MAVAAAAEVTPRLSRWDQEIGRLVETAHALPGPARAAVRSVLVSLLDDPDTDLLEAHSIRRVLELL
jgi:hypothetical protein